CARYHTSNFDSW
nr:immunoglobulin heavy chain junction region [Macaca mulatta]